ncbi:MAG: hypothetical protein V4582_10720 [Pseudomonadota bacterium]
MQDLEDLEERIKLVPAAIPIDVVFWSENEYNGSRICCPISLAFA